MAESAKEGAKVYGASVIRLLAVLGGVGFFAYLYGRWMYETWPATTKVEVDSDDVKIATALAGALGGLFAAALGVEKKRERNAPGVQATFTVGTTLSGAGDAIDPRAIAATVAVWVYFLTGIAAAATWYWNRAVTPDVIKVLAEVMSGYILALIAALGALETK
jgi:hypothetical protein